MMAHKDAVVEANTSGVAFLFKKNKIDAFSGLGVIAGPGKVRVAGADGASETVEAKSIVIATGSDVAPLTGVEIDEERIVTSTGALALGQVPKRLVVVGAGVIGLELGSVWRRLGAEVTVVEFLDHILPGLDGEVGRQAQRILTRQGMTFRLSSKVAAVDKSGKALKVAVEPVEWRRRRDAGGRRGAGRHRPAALHRRASASTRPGSSATIAAASWSTTTTRPRSPASMPSAT